MRIFYATDASLDPGTAPAHHVRAVCDQLVRLGHDVTLFATSVPGDDPPDFAVRRLRTARSLPRTLAVQPALIGHLARAVRQQRPDVIYARQSLLDIAPGLVALAGRIPLVTEVNGRLLAEWRQAETGLLSRLADTTGALRAVQRFNVRAAAAVVCVSAGIKADLDGRLAPAAAKTVTVANGVRTDVFAPTGRDRARRALGLDPGARRAVFVGALQPWQGLDHVIAAFGHLRSSPWALTIVGDGVERTRLEALVTRLGLDRSVTFTGRLPVAAVVEHIGAADVCLYYPDRARGEGASPFKVYEYLACRRPVVAADLPGIRREFGDRLVYCDAESPEALARALMHLDPDAAPEDAPVRSWDVVGDEIDEILRRVAGHPAGAAGAGREPAPAPAPSSTRA